MSGRPILDAAEAMCLALQPIAAKHQAMDIAIALAFMAGGMAAVLNRAGNCTSTAAVVELLHHAMKQGAEAEDLRGALAAATPRGHA